MNRFFQLLAAVAVVVGCAVSQAADIEAAFDSRAARPTAYQPKPVPVIDVTDLYHPHQDVGDNFDILAAYALPELDLRAVILDCTERSQERLAN